MYLNLFAASKGNTLPLLKALTRGVKYSLIIQHRELEMAKDTPVCQREQLKNPEAEVP